MGAGDLEARLVLRDDQLMKTLQNVQSAVEKLSARNTSAAVADGSRFSQALKSAGAVALSLGTIKKGWDFASESLRAYAEKDRQTAENLERIDKSWSRLKESIGGGLALGFNETTDSVVELVGWLDKAYKSATDLYGVGIRMLGGESYEEALGNVEDLNDEQKKARQVQLEGDQTLKYTRDLAVSRMKRAEAQGNNYGASIERIQLDKEDRNKQVSDEVKAGTLTRAQGEEKVRQSDLLAKDQTDRLNRDVAAELRRGQAESKTSQDRIRMRRLEAGLEASTALIAQKRLAGDQKGADLMEIRLRTQEKLLRLSNDPDLSRFDKMNLRDIYTAQEEASIASLKQVTGGRGSVGLSGTTFAQASASSARQNELLKVHSDLLKRIADSTSRLANNGIAAVYAN